MNTAVTHETTETTLWTYASTYGITSLFYAANFYSYGISFSFLSIVAPIFFLGPIYGMLSFWMDAFLLNVTGRLFGGNSSTSHLRLTVARSKGPSILLIAMWLILSVVNPNSVFIQDASNGSGVLIVLSSLIVYLTSFSFLLSTCESSKALNGP